jgi:tetratricopeptide (TPR) repeat protein
VKHTNSVERAHLVGSPNPVGAAVALPLPLAVATLLLLACPGCGHSVDLEAAATFQEAQNTFDQADSPDDFLRAAGLYQTILDRGIVSGAVLFNQGNAYMQADERGRAVAAYRRAKRYRPRDAYLDANLRYARGTENPAGRRPVIEYLLFWQEWLSYPEKFRLAGAAAYVTFALGLVALFWKRRLFSRLALAGLAMTLLFAFSAGYDWYRHDAIVHGVIVDDEVTARKGNATSYEPAFTEPLTESTEFRLVERRGDWLLIRLPAGQEGWVEQEAAVTY